MLASMPARGWDLARSDVCMLHTNLNQGPSTRDSESDTRHRAAIVAYREYQRMFLSKFPQCVAAVTMCAGVRVPPSRDEGLPA